ncbi:MAG: efflux RND transporter permease subunit, partial [Desulfatiglandales bacterium]
MEKETKSSKSAPSSRIEGVIRFCLARKVLVFLAMLLVLGWGILVSPFDWRIGGPLRDPVPVDAIPDIGDNQQIVFTEWAGRSPQDVEDQITYPLTASLLGVPRIKSIRSFSMFGFSSIYLIFHDDVDFYWSRSRILEKLNSLPEGTLPEDVQPALGPDATAMGQVFWYTLEGRDEDGLPTGGWDLHELRSIQDWYVRFGLLSVEGVSEVAAVGGFVQEYQVDLDPDRMRVNDVTLSEVVAAVRGANRDVGAQTIEVNRVEYLVRGIGFIKELGDLENTVIKLRDGVPVFVRNVANVTLGPASRQGALDKGGAETVGAVVVVRYGENPLKVIENVKEKIAQISPGLPKKTLPDGRVSQVRIIPFYDRTELIHETLGTLRTALTNEILLTIIVIVVAVMHVTSSLIIAGLLPLAVLLCFIAMKVFGVDANIVALSGIAIAIGTMVDMGIIVTENILRSLREAGGSENRREIVFRATREVGGAVLTAVSTTVVSFLPVFAMEGSAGKLFRPLAFTKTFALVASLIVALAAIPPLAHLLFAERIRERRYGALLYEGIIYLGVIVSLLIDWRPGLVLVLIGAYNLALPWMSERVESRGRVAVNLLCAAGVLLVLAEYWLPLGPEKGMFKNVLFILVITGGLLGLFYLFYRSYTRILGWCLDHKLAFLTLPLIFLLFGALIWQGFDGVFGWLPRFITGSAPMSVVARHFEGLGQEFIPPLDEGAYLFMPTTMPHASIGEVMDILQKQDIAIQAVPEVETVVGKLGRVRSPLDPAPVSMIETLIAYKEEYLKDPEGRLRRFQFIPQGLDVFRDEDGTPLPGPDGKPYLVRGRYARDGRGRLITDPSGKLFRLWRVALDPALNPGRDQWPGIRRPDDIWDAVVKAAQIPGTTSPARLQPISARLVMLQSGIRASMGIRVFGPDLETIQKVSLKIEGYLREIPDVEPATVIADRVIGKPYIEIIIDKQAIAQYGISIQQMLEVVEFAIGGKRITTTVEGRERYPVRVRYIRELRDELESLGRILVPAPEGNQIPLLQLADITYVRGPSVIKGEDTFLVGYVLFDKRPDRAEVDVVEQVRDYLKEKIEYGEFRVPAGVSYSFTGTYENQVRSEKKLKVILPVALMIIFVILYLQFKSAATSFLVFSGIAVAWSGGFVMLWLYAQPWFLDFYLFGTSMRELFQIHTINLSVAVWVGFLALFGIASDDGVVMATYLDGTFSERRPETVPEVRKATIEASLRRVRPCLMTTATTILALIPVLTSTGRGSDIMVPMAIPCFGGMCLEIVTMLVVPVLYCAVKEAK